MVELEKICRKKNKSCQNILHIDANNKMVDILLTKFSNEWKRYNFYENFINLQMSCIDFTKKNRTPGSECCLYLNLGSYTRAGVQYVFVFVFVFKYTNISICICILKPTRRNICICIWLAYLGVFDKYFFKYTFHFYTLFQQKLIIHPHVLVLGYCVHIWQMSLQLSCGNS